METTITTAINTAKRITKEVAEMKDYRVRNKALRADRESARKLLRENGGYIIIKGRVYGYTYNDIWRTIDLVPVR